MKLSSPPPSLKNLVMVKRAQPKRVTLPNGRTIIARYDREKHTDLPTNVHKFEIVLCETCAERQASSSRR